MLAPQALLRLIISRLLPQANPDNPNSDASVRGGRYGEFYTLPLVRKAHLLADEGSLFVANNAGVGVATSATPTAFSDTAPLLTIFNTDVPTNPSYKRIYLDMLRLIVTAAGTAGTDFQIQIKLDNANRYASGGTVLTPISPNMDITPGSIAQVRYLPVATAASVNARTVVGIATLLNKMNPAPIPIGATIVANFGGVEATNPVSATQSSSSVVPPIIIGPQQCALINFQILSQSAATSLSPELSWWER